MNLTYVLWVMAQSLCFLTLYCAIHVLWYESPWKGPPINIILISLVCVL